MRTQWRITVLDNRGIKWHTHTHTHARARALSLSLSHKDVMYREIIQPFCSKAVTWCLDSLIEYRRAKRGMRRFFFLAAKQTFSGFWLQTGPCHKPLYHYLMVEWLSCCRSFSSNKYVWMLSFWNCANCTCLKKTIFIRHVIALEHRCLNVPLFVSDYNKKCGGGTLPRRAV